MTQLEHITFMDYSVLKTVNKYYNSSTFPWFYRLGLLALLLHTYCTTLKIHVTVVEIEDRWLVIRMHMNLLWKEKVLATWVSNHWVMD